MSKFASKFDKTTTSDDVCNLLGSQAKDKHIIITGGAGGLGWETARALAVHGAHVLITCRSEAQGSDAISRIKKLHPDVDVDFAAGVELGSLASVRDFAKSYINGGKPLDILINNAGVMACPLQYTSDGLEMQFGVNHISHFLLTKLLLPVLTRSGTQESKSRVISLSSIGNWLYSPACGILLDDLDGKKCYHKWERYGQSKLANILFAKELNSICAAQNLSVVSCAVHPGVILETGLAKHNSLATMVADQFAYFWNSPCKLHAILAPYQKNSKQGAATTLLTALTPELTPGGWYCDCQETTAVLHATANDSTLAKALWDKSEDIVKDFL